MAADLNGHQDLTTYLRILWRWKLLFLAFVVLIPLGAYLVESGKQKVYESSTLVEPQNGTSGPLPVTSGNTLAVARLVTTAPIARRAALLLNLPVRDAGQLAGEVSASGDTNTGFITITVQDHNPNRAAAVATAFARALGGYQTRQSIHNINLQIASLVQQLNSTPRSDPGSRQGVSQQIAQLRAERGASGVRAQILEPATPNPSPVAPRPRRAVELALLIAALLGIGAVILAENTDRRLRSPDDLEQLTEWPLLGVIASTAFSPGGDATPRDEEAFNMLRADLTHFNVGRSLKTVAIISPLVGDGKTTVAAGLAVATARAGKRAILVDGDLRRPQVSSRLRVDPGPGLGAVLAGEVPLANAMLDYQVPGYDGVNLRVLPAGRPPSNPTALINSDRMRDVLRALEDQADLVIVDTAAALAVSDAMPIMQAASGVVMIVRMNRSSRAAVRRLRRVVLSARAAVLGVVATGTTMTAAGYTDYYSSYGESGSTRARLQRQLRFWPNGSNGHSRNGRSGVIADSAATRSESSET